MARNSSLGRALAVLAALAVAVAGCGGGSGGRLSKSQYESQLRSIGDEVSANISSIGTIGQNPSGAQIDTYVGRAETALNHAADRLKGLNPPKDATADNQKLAAAVRFFAGSLEQLKVAAKKQDKTALRNYVQTLANSGVLQQARAATTDLRAKGYDVGSPLGG